MIFNHDRKSLCTNAFHVNFTFNKQSEGNEESISVVKSAAGLWKKDVGDFISLPTAR